MILIGSAYSYLQEFLPNVAQAVVRPRPGRYDRPRTLRLKLSRLFE
jgi:hypothetical protein